MIIDNNNIFSDGQAVTATAASTNVIDTGAPGTPFGAAGALTPDIGKLDGHGVPLQVNVTQAFNNLTSLQIDYQVSSDNSSFSTVASRVYLLAELGVGRLNFPARIPEGANKQYHRLNYTVTGTAPTTGKLFAGVVADRHTNG